MPGRRKRHQFKSKYKSKAKSKKLAFVLAIILVLLTVASFVVYRSAFGGASRISTVALSSNGDVVFSLYDFGEGLIANVTIPGNTEVDVARSLGSWIISSVWKLGENEKVSGDRLLAETTTKSLKMPVTSVSPNFVEKSKIAYLKFNTKPAAVVDIDLAKSNYLARTKLGDGSLGYKVSGKDLPFELRTILADSRVSKENLNILFENRSDEALIETEVGKVIDVIGGKVASVVKGNLEDTDCTIYGSNKTITYQVLASVFSCKTKSKLDNYNFDIVLRVGTSFAARY